MLMGGMHPGMEDLQNSVASLLASFAGTPSVDGGSSTSVGASDEEDVDLLRPRGSKLRLQAIDGMCSRCTSPGCFRGVRGICWRATFEGRALVFERCREGQHLKNRLVRRVLSIKRERERCRHTFVHSFQSVWK